MRRMEMGRISSEIECPNRRNVFDPGRLDHFACKFRRPFRDSHDACGAPQNAASSCAFQPASLRLAQLAQQVTSVHVEHIRYAATNRRPCDCVSSGPDVATMNNVDAVPAVVVE